MSRDDTGPLSDDAAGPTEAIGLLDQIADTALDDDYYVVRAGETEPSRRFNTTLTAVALGVFALMVTVTAVQTATNRPATEREQQALAQDVSVRRAISADRRDLVESLRSDVRELSAASGQDDPAADELRATTADLPVRGPGVRIVVTPGSQDLRAEVSDSDLQALVNALWFVGAEAIAINDQRVGTLTSIRSAGEAITVNYTSISPPYTVRAIGDIKALRERLLASRLGQDWLARADTTDLTFQVTGATDQRLAAVSEDRQKILHAQPVRSAS